MNTEKSGHECWWIGKNPCIGCGKLSPLVTNFPGGKTCGHCVHIGRCTFLLNRKGTEIECDWCPSRFEFLRGKEIG